jgi:hypothetical protein
MGLKQCSRNALFLLMWSTVTLFAQDADSLRLSGRVTDSTGAGLASSELIAASLVLACVLTGFNSLHAQHERSSGITLDRLHRPTDHLEIFRPLIILHAALISHASTAPPGTRLGRRGQIRLGMDVGTFMRKRPRALRGHAPRDDHETPFRWEYSSPDGFRPDQPFLK